MKIIIDFIGKKHYAFGLSVFLSIMSLLLLTTKSLNFSIDFKGGTIIEFLSQHENIELKVKDLFSKRYADLEIHKIDNEKSLCCNYNLKLSASDEIDSITEKLKQEFPDMELNHINYIGPKIGAEFALDATKAIIFSLLAMMIYVWIRFDFIFGLGVMLALLHDVLITLGFFSLFEFQFDLTSIAVILTVVGYSINDSIVIYDRIRENLTQNIKTIHRKEFSALVNRSINETLSRTIMTSLTTLIVCIALLIFGGEALRGFSAGLSFGIAFGTYSSIYVSAPVLMFFTKK